MNHVQAIAARMSLRPPQRRSLEILGRLTELVPPKKGQDLAAALAAVRAEFPSVGGFERDFPSVCFALATGVGKTRLMGAFISYLHLAHGVNNFFVLAPNLTVYEKLIADFTPNTPKYVFKGIAELALDTPVLVTGDDYESGRGVRETRSLPGLNRLSLNVFNIAKIAGEMRGGREPRIKRLSEYIGQSYFDYLASLPDLVLVMDESHHYRAKAGMKAINELRPVLGLELTATPFTESGQRTTRFQNVAYDYPLGQAMADGFVKEPAVVTRKDFMPNGMAPEEIERMKLEDGVRLHESVKVELQTYALQTGNAIVKPFLLVIARDTTHAASLLGLIKSDAFFGGAYREKVLQIDSSQGGEEKEGNVQRLLRVEQADEPTEIVIHVNMLKEGWDVTNLYTIVPLRPAEARTLIEQSIGRGLRLPYGKRTGVTAVDRLNIIAHDKFQEILDAAGRADSPIRLQAVELSGEQLGKTISVIARSRLLEALGGETPTPGPAMPNAALPPKPLFERPAEKHAARLAYDAMLEFAGRPQEAPAAASLLWPEIQASLARRVGERFEAYEPTLPGLVEKPDFAAIARTVAQAFVSWTIDIPRIVVLPKGELRPRFERFELDLESLRYQPISEELWIQHLRTSERESLALGPGGLCDQRPEDYVVAGLVDFDDIDYQRNAEVLYDLAAQLVKHLCGYLSEEEARRVVRCYQRQIAELIHAQLEPHHREEPVEYEAKVLQGFTALKECVYTAAYAERLLTLREPPPKKSEIGRHVYGGFARGLYAVTKFQSDPERLLAIILDREAEKWFRPAKGQFQIYYRWAGRDAEYQPDFVAETKDAILMIEVKRRADLESGEVQAKEAAALTWCRYASEHARAHDRKGFRYLLVPDDEIAENLGLDKLTE